MTVNMAMTVSIRNIEVCKVVVARQDHGQEDGYPHTLGRNYTDKRLTCSCHNVVRIFLFLILDHTRSAICLRFVGGMH